MPKCGYIENKISVLEKFDVKIHYNKKDVRSDKQFLVTYSYDRWAPGDWTVAEWIKNRFKTTFVGYSVVVLFADKTSAPGNARLKTVRASYLEDKF